ncbi:hypothetical protein H1R20_g15501, partial [Candolleomyces eurysporus]
MGRKLKYRTEEERKMARRKQRLERSLRPRATEAHCEENRRAYAKRKVIWVPEPSDVVQALAKWDILMADQEHVYDRHSIAAEPLKLLGTALTDADFQSMIGHPPYPSHIVEHVSFEKDWPQISAAFLGYATRTYVTEHTRWLDQAGGHDRASLSSDLSKQYRDLLEDYEQFTIDVEENADFLPAELIAFQNRLWTSRRLVWLAGDLGSLTAGTDVLLTALQARISHLQCNTIW